jgi:hypothetical protein
MTRSRGDARFRPIASTPNRKAACGAPPVGAMLSTLNTSKARAVQVFVRLGGCFGAGGGGPSQQRMRRPSPSGLRMLQ